VVQREQTSEPAIADAVADVAHSAQRIVEERIELLRLEVRNDMRRIIRASALGASGVVALAVAVGMAAGSVTWTLALWMPFGAALGITAVLTAVVGVILSSMARKRFPGAEEDAGTSQSGERQTGLVRARNEAHEVEATTT